VAVVAAAVHRKPLIGLADQMRVVVDWATRTGCLGTWVHVGLIPAATTGRGGSITVTTGYQYYQEVVDDEVRR
jgi:hypothetical protein